MDKNLETLAEGIAAKLVTVERERNAYRVSISMTGGGYFVYWDGPHAESVARSIRAAIIAGIQEYAREPGERSEGRG